MLLSLYLISTTAFTGPNVDYKLESSDSEFTMEVNREQSKVSVLMNFADATKIKYVKLERSMDAANNFTMCGYIGFAEQKQNVSVTKRDNYPFPVTGDSYYRLRVAYKDETERIYPPVRLPSLN